jgi:hypothetical protein
MAGARIRPSVAALALVLAALAGSGTAWAERSLSAVFPKLDPAALAQARSQDGYSATGDSSPRFLPSGEAAAIIAKALEGRESSFLVETLTIVPGKAAASKLDLFNAITRYRGLSGVTYSSKSKGEGSVLFNEVTRIADLRKATPLPDLPAASLPASAEQYIRLKDANFGTSYYRVRLDTSPPGIVFAMSNARSLDYFFIPVVAADRLFCIFYVEQASEGLLIYSVSGGKVSGTAAKQVNISSAVRKRAMAISGWLVSSLER